LWQRSGETNFVLRRYLLRLPAQMTGALVTTLGNIDDASDENRDPSPVMRGQNTQ
jgi:hypothetical protein